MASSSPAPPQPSRRALIIGNSDGIGLETTKRLLARDWHVSGLSRSACPISHERYAHVVQNVNSSGYLDALRRVVLERGPFDCCIYCVGIGTTLDVLRIGIDAEVFEVNLLGAVRTAEVVIPSMLDAGNGHLVVLSSQADRSILKSAPSYSASKAAVSSYFEGLGLALRPRGIAVTNIRFGFVETKMAKASTRPFMLTTQQAASIVETALEKRPLRLTRPRRMAALMGILRTLEAFRIWFS